MQEKLFKKVKQNINYHYKFMKDTGNKISFKELINIEYFLITNYCLKRKIIVGTAKELKEIIKKAIEDNKKIQEYLY